MENTEEKTDITPKPTKQMPGWLVAFLRWGLVILVAFALGALFIALVVHLPLQQTYNEVSADLEKANGDVTQLTGQVNELTASNETMGQDLANISLKQAITGSLAEVRAARLAIAADDPAGARLAVTRAIQSLDTLATLIDKDHSDIVTNMQDKANQANTDLQSGLTAAVPALEQLDTNLVSLLDALFPIR